MGIFLVAKITPCFENGKQAIVQIDFSFAFATTEVIPLKGVPSVFGYSFLHYVPMHPGLRRCLHHKLDGSTRIVSVCQRRF